MTSTRTVITLPPQVRAGQPFEVQVLIAHPMETGHRRDADGRLLPRDILNHFQVQLDGVTVFEADFFPAMAANPYLSFSLVAQRSGMLTLNWRGDKGFAHTESRPLTVIA
jgi:sulfur-oxidizing protein SoxZ